MGNPNWGTGRASVPFHLMAPLNTEFIQQSSLLIHLWLESDLLDTASGPTRACGRMWVEQQFHQYQLDDYALDLERAQARIVEQRRAIQATPRRKSNELHPTISMLNLSMGFHAVRTAAYLVLESYHLAFSLSTQGSAEARNMPSPLAAQLRLDCLLRFGSKMIFNMGDYLWHIIMARPDLSTLPVHLSPPIYLALSIIQGWDLGAALHHPQQRGVPLNLESIYQILLEDQLSSPTIVARIKAIPRYRLDTRQVQRPEDMTLQEGGEAVHGNGNMHPPMGMADGMAPQFLPSIDAYGGDMSWLLDSESDWMALMNERGGGV